MPPVSQSLYISGQLMHGNISFLDSSCLGILILALGTVLCGAGLSEGLQLLHRLALVLIAHAL